MNLGRALAGVARDLLAEGTVQHTLDRIVELAVHTLPGCDHAGITLLTPKGIRTPAATSRFVGDADALQHETGQGPCMDAARQHEIDMFRVHDMSHEVDRWPRFAPRALEVGVGSMLSFRLFTNADTLGALNMYSKRIRAFGTEDEENGWLFASHAAVALAAAQHAAHLQTAMETRTRIGEAIGILVERHHLTSDAAFATLTKASQDHNIKLRDLAERITRVGDLP